MRHRYTQSRCSGSPGCSWNQAVQKQRNAKLKRQPAFDVVNSVKRYGFFADIKVHHMVIFGKTEHLRKRKRERPVLTLFSCSVNHKIKARVIY